MKDVLRYIVAGAIVVFGLLILAFTSWRTLDLLALVMPGEGIFHALGLVLFDVGFVLWTLTFIFHAEGIIQRAIALAGALFGLVAVILAVVVDLAIGGQDLVTVPDWFGWLALVLISVAVAVNLTLMFLFHLTMPMSLAAIREQQKKDRQAQALQEQEDLIEREAMQMFGARRQGISSTLAEGMAEEMTGRLRDRFRAPNPDASHVAPPNGAAPKVERK